MDTQSPKSKRTTNFSLLILGTLVGLIAVEITARCILYFRTPSGMYFDPDIIYTYKPGTQIRDMTVNSIGCIGDEMSLEKAGNEKRVLLLGGSTSFSRVYVETVKEVLVAAYPKNEIQVVSCGKPRYTSAVNLANLQKNLIQYQPDVIVLYLGINDNLYNTFYWVEGIPEVGFFDWKTTEESIFLKLLNYHILKKKFYATPHFGPEHLRSGPIFRENIVGMIELARKQDINVLLSTFAISHPSPSVEWLNWLRSIEEVHFHFWGSIESTILGVHKHNDILRALARDYKLPIVSIDEELSGKYKNFIDLCHFHDEGNKVFGTLIGEGVIGSLS